MPEKSRKHLKLLFSISELSHLIGESSDVENFLHRTAALVSEYLNVPVCSIYLLEEETGELVLRATKGLSPEAVGRVRMPVGTGLVGATLETLAPVCEGDAPTNPRFKYFTVAGEDPFRSFLSVPIVRGKVRIGVLVVQHEIPDYFDDTDIRTLRTLASQAAGAIGSVRVLMAAGGGEKAPASCDRLQEACLIKGTAASPGVAFGPATVFTDSHVQGLNGKGAGPAGCTLTDFRRAIRTTADQLVGLQQKLMERLPEGASLISEAHLLILKDPKFTGGVAERVEKGAPVTAAIKDVARMYMGRFRSSPDPYLQEKADDIADLAGRVLENLSSADRRPRPYLAEKVVVAKNLYPSEVLRFAVEGAAGIVLVGGGATSHVAILARSLKIPSVIVREPELLDLPEETPLLIDADLGNLYVRPSAQVTARFKERIRAQDAADALARPESEDCRTRDGTPVLLLANINLLGELPTARQLKAGGVGLYRTEFPFMVRSGILSEEEQVGIYRRLFEEMPGKPVTVRTLDVGGDKILPGADGGAEPNPELGLRSIRFSLAFPELFAAQIRAILRAGAGCDALQIAFPMIGSVDEFEKAAEWVNRCIEELAAEGTQRRRPPALGAMVEVPSAVEVIDALAERADFLSVGTNDLVQYILAVDRTGEKVADWYRPEHPAVLRTLKRIADAARRAGKPVSVCGEIAHDPDFIPFLLGIGFRTLSVDPAHLFGVRRRVAELNLAEAGRFAERLVGETTISATRKRMASFGAS